MLITLVEIASSSPSTTFSTLLTTMLILNLQHHKNTWEVRKKQLWRPRYCCTEQGERGNKSLTRSWINFSWVLFCFSIFSSKDSRASLVPSQNLPCPLWCRHTRSAKNSRHTCGEFYCCSSMQRCGVPNFICNPNSYVSRCGSLNFVVAWCGGEPNTPLVLFGSKQF